jgi:SAM-dependent methyltransferase
MSSPTSSESQPFFIDGAAFYMADGLHTLLYDQLYGRHAARWDDIRWYDALATHTGPDILVGACGTGRVCCGLATPQRRIAAFDASPMQLKQAIARNDTLDEASRVQLSQQRLESFTYDRQFDLILMPYYGFGHLLDADSRLACLQRIAAHLKPGGRAVIHLPAPEVLQIPVPPEEAAKIRNRQHLQIEGRGTLTLEQSVQRMDYLPDYGLRVMQLNAALSLPDGRVVTQHPASLYYAVITKEMLADAAASAGLSLANVRKGFYSNKDDSAATELIAVFTRARLTPYGPQSLPERGTQE